MTRAGYRYSAATVREATSLDSVPRDCPECGETRRTAETLRVHRWLAHDVRAAS